MKRWGTFPQDESGSVTVDRVVLSIATPAIAMHILPTLGPPLQVTAETSGATV
jgi:hypothetical protein